MLRIADAPGTDPPGHRYRALADQLARLGTDDRCAQNSVVPASRGFCDILAIHVGIVRKSETQKQIADKVRVVAIASISAMPLKASWSPAQ